MRKSLIVLAAVAALALAPFQAVSAQEVDPLNPGWNLVGAKDETVSAFVEARNEVSECTVRAIWRFNGDQTWSAWFSNAPELDEIGNLLGQGGFWVFCAADEEA